MANDIDKLIREEIGDILTAANATARVWPYNALSHKLAEWPGLVRTAAGGTHGYVVMRNEVAGEWKNSVRDRRIYTYSIWSFYGFRTGKVGDNSDDEFSVILEANYEAFKAQPRLNLDATVEQHDLLQYKSITTIDCGEETLHLAIGKLEVRLCC